jgi:hypothetical protein
VREVRSEPGTPPPPHHARAETDLLDAPLTGAALDQGDVPPDPAWLERSGMRTTTAAFAAESVREKAMALYEQLSESQRAQVPIKSRASVRCAHK